MVKNPNHFEKSIIRLRYALAGLKRKEINHLVYFVEGLASDMRDSYEQEKD